jgi:hypothetical protein
MSGVQEDPQWEIYRFTARQGKQTVSVEISAESGLSDTLEAIETFLIAVGFDPDAVRKSFA